MWLRLAGPVLRRERRDLAVIDELATPRRMSPASDTHGRGGKTMTIDTLPTCSKVPFASEGEALRRLDELAFTATRRDGLPIRSYRCPSCRSWHLTRRP